MRAVSSGCLRDAFGMMLWPREWPSTPRPRWISPTRSRPRCWATLLRVLSCCGSTSRAWTTASCVRLLPSTRNCPSPQSANIWLLSSARLGSEGSACSTSRVRPRSCSRSVPRRQETWRARPSMAGWLAIKARPCVRWVLPRCHSRTARRPSPRARWWRRALPSKALWLSATP